MSVSDRQDEVVSIPDSMPVLPLRDVVIFPGMITPLLVGRPRSLAALDEAMKGERLLLVVTQRQMNVDDPEPGDLYSLGTVVKILQLMRLVEGTMRILVEGVSRGEIARFHRSRKYLRAQVRAVKRCFARLQPDGGHGSQRVVAVHRVRAAQQAHPRRGAAFGTAHRGPRPSGRFDRLAHHRQDRIQAAAAGGRRPARALPHAGHHPGRRTGDPAPREEDRGRGAAARSRRTRRSSTSTSS